jgi:hypothetical protein
VPDNPAKSLTVFTRILGPMTFCRHPLKGTSEAAESLRFEAPSKTNAESDLPDWSNRALLFNQILLLFLCASVFGVG